MIVYEIYDVVEYFYENKKDLVITLIVGGIGLYVGIQVVSSVPNMIMVNL
jgi:hypothetical protein